MEVTNINRDKDASSTGLTIFFTIVFLIVLRMLFAIVLICGANFMLEMSIPYDFDHVLGAFLITVVLRGGK